MSKFINSKQIGILVLILAIAAVGAYYIRQNLSLAEWKTYQYQSHRFNIEFKYPPELEIIEDIREGLPPYSEDTIVLSIFSKEDKGESTSGMMYLNSAFSEFTPGIKELIKTESYNLNGSSVELKTYKLKTSEEVGEKIGIYTNFRHRGNYNYINLSSSSNDGDPTKKIKNILSTFKYTDLVENDYKQPCPQKQTCD